MFKLTCAFLLISTYVLTVECRPGFFDGIADTFMNIPKSYISKFIKSKSEPKQKPNDKPEEDTDTQLEAPLPDVDVKQPTEGKKEKEATPPVDPEKKPEPKKTPPEEKDKPK